MPTAAFDIQHLTAFLVRHRWPWHVGFWLLYAASRAFPYYLTVMYYERNYLEFMFIIEATLIVLVYTTLWLYERFPKWTFFAVGLLIWVGFTAEAVSFQKYYLRSLPEVAQMQWTSAFLSTLTKYVFMFALLVLAKYFKDTYIQQYYDAQRRQLQMQSELEHLKGQVSPHFLFNTMNNFYGLAVERSDKLPELMVRLSGLLRYSLYETQSATVPLVREIAQLRDYVALEKIRLEEGLEFQFDSSVPDTCDLHIAPLLLIVFVENAFKHAKNVQNDNVRISITMSVSAEGVFAFEVKNNCLPSDPGVPQDSQGIGLDNVQKRLRVLYPGDEHRLLIEKREGVFQVHLSLHLKKNEA